MDSEILKLGGTDVSVKISCDRVKNSINVIGNFTAADAVKKVNECVSAINCGYLLKPEMTSAPIGYVINISGKKSVRDWILNKNTVLCSDIFKIARNVQEIYERYGPIVLSQIIFDYTVVFVNESITELEFIVAPFSDKDRKRSGFYELLHILFIHMSSTDNESEIAVAELIKKIRIWENAGYAQYEFSAFREYTERYFSNDAKNRQRDFMPKSGFVIRQFFGNSRDDAKKRLKRCIRVSIVCEECDKDYVYTYDPQENMFFYGTEITERQIFCQNSLKIGREESWAAIYTDDMTVSGRFAEIVYTDGKFFLKKLAIIDSGNCGLYSPDDAYVLKDRQKIQIGKRLYTFGLQGRRHYRYK